MGLVDSFLDAVGVNTDPATQVDPETAAAYAGGDPVMGQMAAGHDPAETNAAGAEIEATEKAQGKPLSDAQTAAVLARHPGADASLATGPATARKALRAVGGFFGGLLGGLKWVLVVVVVVVLLGLFFRVRGK